jgi:hypothetical protein
MAFTIGSGTFTNGSATVTGVTLTSGTLAYFASGTRMVVGVNPVIQEVEAIAAPTVTTITLRSAWTGTGGTYSFLANQTSEGLRDAVQAIRSNNASLQSFIDSIDTAATADSVAQRTSDGSINAVNLSASGNVAVGTTLSSMSGGIKVIQIGTGTADGFFYGLGGNDTELTTNAYFNSGYKYQTTGTPSTRYFQSSGVHSWSYAPSGTADEAITFTEAMRITSSGNVGIGTSSPAHKLQVGDGSSVGIGTSPITANFNQKGNWGSGEYEAIQFGVSQLRSVYSGTGSLWDLAFATYNGSYNERMRIDSSGNVLIGKTGVNFTTVGSQFIPSSGANAFTSNNIDTLGLNRLSSDGGIIGFYKDSVQVGSISSALSSIAVGTGNTQLLFWNAQSAIFPSDGTTTTDNSIDFGNPNYRFQDIYATNGTIQTSDRNDKQDIEELSEAEHRVAVACKGLLRKFRWKSAFKEKGDGARIHFGIIAQDLQAAFEAEGLDAGRYAMFIYGENWEHEVEVPAVEAQDAVYETVVIPAEYDEEGNEVSHESTEQRLVSEAVQAQEAYTRTDVYFSEEEAPEGSVKKSRMGVRYSELLAFIIAGL